MGECDLKRLVFDARKFLSVMNLWEAVADSGQHRSCERPIQACEHLNVRNRRRKSLQNKSNVVIQNEYAIHDGREKFTRCKSVSSPRSHALAAFSVVSRGAISHAGWSKLSQVGVDWRVFYIGILCKIG